MNNNQNNHVLGKFEIEERRRKIASMLAQSMTEDEIASELGIAQPTVSRDVKVLKQMSQQFVFDLAKSDLAYYYVQCIEGMEAVLRKAWEIHNSDNTKMSTRDKLLALKVIIEANKGKFELFERGPSMMNWTALEERLSKIEGRQEINSRNR